MVTSCYRRDASGYYELMTIIGALAIVALFAAGAFRVWAGYRADRDRKRSGPMIMGPVRLAASDAGQGAVGCMSGRSGLLWDDLLRDAVRWKKARGWV